MVEFDISQKSMADRTDEEKLDAALAMITKIETTLGTLYEKTATSTSFGDQSLTLTSIADLGKSRDRWRQEAETLKASVNRHRKTLKIQFR